MRRFVDKCLKPLRNKRGGLGVPKSETDIIAFFETEEGKTMKEIADELASRGIRNRKGKEISENVVAAILKNRR